MALISLRRLSAKVSVLGRAGERGKIIRKSNKRYFIVSNHSKN